jgi:hypothetical protein
MSDKKRRWWMILNEILRNNGKVGDAKWKELAFLIKGFVQLKDSCHWARAYGARKWHKKFLYKMVEEAKFLKHWKAVVRLSEVDSPIWKDAISRVYQMTNDEGDVYYRWQELKYLLPENHALLPKVRAEMSRIRQKKKDSKRLAV